MKYCIQVMLMVASGSSLTFAQSDLYVFNGIKNGPDNTEILNSALNYVNTNNISKIVIPEGKYFFHTKPDDIDFDIEIEGSGKNKTILYRDYIELNGNGFFNYTPGSAGSKLSNMTIKSTVSSSGGAALRLYGNLTGAPDFSVFENLILTYETNANKNWDYAVVIDGTERTALSVGGAIGVRDVDFFGSQLFSGKVGALRLNGVVAFSFQGGGIFWGGNKPSEGPKVAVYIDGTEEVESYYINIDTTVIPGLLLQRSIYGNFRAGVIDGDITTSSFTRDNLVLGPVYGTVEEFWVNSKHINPAN